MKLCLLRIHTANHPIFTSWPREIELVADQTLKHDALGGNKKWKYYPENDGTDVLFFEKGSSMDLILNFVDLFREGIAAVPSGWAIRKEDFINVLSGIFGDVPQGVRTDNGSQATATDVAIRMVNMRIKHEFIHASTPLENTQIESFYFIMQRAMVRRRALGSLKTLHEALARFCTFRNHERLHSTINQRPSMVFLAPRNMG